MASFLPPPPVYSIFQACPIVTPLPGRNSRNRFEALQAGVQQQTCSAGIYFVNIFILPADIVCVGTEKNRFIEL